MEEAKNYTVKDAAAYIGMSEDYIRKRVRDGSLAHYRHGWTIRFSKEHLDAFLESKERNAKEE